MKKTLKIEENTHQRLIEYGKKKDTFDSIINRLLDKEVAKVKK